MLSKKFFAGLLALNLTVCTAIVGMVGGMVTPACALAFSSPTMLPDNADLLFDRNGQIMNPTVRVHAHGSTGSATALDIQTPKGTIKTMFVTNYHVIAENLPKDCVPSKKDKCDAPQKIEPVILRGWVTQDSKTWPIIYKANVIAFDKTNDLAVLETTTTWAGPTAKIMGTDVPLVPGEDVWVAGAALGEQVHITAGLLSLKHHEYNDLNFYVTSAPIMPGNSGGGFYIQRNHVYLLAGVPDAIGVSSGQMMPSHGYIIPIRRVIEALAAMKLTVVER